MTNIFFYTQYRYDAHADPDKVICVSTRAGQQTQRVFTNQALRDALAAAGKLGVEMIQ